MLNVIPIVFLVGLAMAGLYALRNPALAAILAIAAYGLEQIAANFLPQLQIYPYAFNVGVGTLILASLVLSLLRDPPAFPRTVAGRRLLLLVWAFAACFWLSSLWSPFSEPEKNLALLPYFLLNVIILPFLVRGHDAMVRAILIVWGLLFVGSCAVLLSPNQESSEQLGRFALRLDYGDPDIQYANPLALADMGVFLALSSLFLLCAGPSDGRVHRPRRLLLQLALVAGLVTGLSIAFLSGRGELLCGLVVIALFGVLIRARNIPRAMTLFALSTLVLALVLFALYQVSYERIVHFSPRFSSSAILDSMDIRRYLLIASFEAYASEPKAWLLGLGARACEESLGMYSHSSLLQALAETGIVGLTMLCTCYVLALRFGARTLTRCRQLGHIRVAYYVIFLISLLVYHLLVSNKKGSLAQHDTYMWLALIATALDRLYSRERRPAAVPPPAKQAP
ncbi:MAG: hypothetical protein K8T26_08585 [Lentisphaerae bacterium]|nr:hypothetical protein [Lentisphaerota bacterium]